jgi:hypothetical protein
MNPSGCAAWLDGIKGNDTEQDLGIRVFGESRWILQFGMPPAQKIAPRLRVARFSVASAMLSPGQFAVATVA